MVRVLIPVFLLLIVAIVILVIHRRESKVGKIRELESKVTKYETTLEALDSAAAAEYTVTNNNFAAYARNEIRKVQ